MLLTTTIYLTLMITSAQVMKRQSRQWTTRTHMDNQIT